MTTMTWKNGREINWNSRHLRLSRMVPNGCSTTFCKGQLDEIERAVDQVLSPFHGHIGWEKDAPVGALIVAKFIEAVSMYSSCYCYGTQFRNGRYYERYVSELVGYGMREEDARGELDQLILIFGRFFRTNGTIRTNVGRDCEGLSYNSFTMGDGVLNVRIAK